MLLLDIMLDWYQSYIYC